MGEKTVRHRVTISPWFVLMASAALFGVAFLAGSFGRCFVLRQIDGVMPQQSQPAVDDEMSLPILATNQESLPPPKVRSDKIVPKTLYSGKITSSKGDKAKTMLLEQSREQQLLQQKQQACEADQTCSAKEEPVDVGREAHPGDDEEHLPAGQHLLVDLKDVDGAFLNSAPRLAQAMVDVVYESDLTLLSYHCHELLPSGVSCVGVLLESHISFHTWPEEGVITLDLFTCGSGLLIPILPSIARLFAVASPDPSAQAPSMLWSHKLRGFRPKSPRSTMGTSSDLGTTILEKMVFDLKEEVASVGTAFQTVDVYDVILPKNQPSLYQYHLSLDPANGSYESQNPDLFRPDRRVFLDGVLQSTRLGLEAYHEALVHPAMFAHPNPKRAAIIGGGEGATLREILKHKTIEVATMIEIDEGMVSTSRKALPEWNTCHDIQGSTPSCFDDPRTDLRCEDALAYFVDGYSKAEEIKEESKFDVIIMDALDPQDDIPFAEVLYGNPIFTQSLFNALTDDGIIVLQVGISPGLKNVADELGASRHRATLIQDLQSVGFASMHTYEESHCKFGAPWVYLLACRKYSCRQGWFAQPPQVDYEIQKRTLETVSGAPILKHFDGASMQTYRLPHKAYETIFCRRPNPPEECSYLRGYDPMIPNIPKDQVEIKLSPQNAIGDQYGIFTKVDIPKGAMILQESSSISATFEPRTLLWMYQVAELHPLASQKIQKGVLAILHKYGFSSMLLGGAGMDIHCSPLTLVNHGCDGTFNIHSDDTFDITEQTADPNSLPKDQIPKHFWRDLFNPVVERHLPHLTGGFDVAARDIAAGEEILDNYLLSVVTQEGWKALVEELKEICSHRA